MVTATSTERACGWCGIDISDKRSNAEYCSLQHKKNAASKRHRARNPGYYKGRDEYHAAYREENRAAINTKAREHVARKRANDPGYVEHQKQWWASNGEKHRQYQAKRRASKMNHPDSVEISERDWLKMLRRYNHCCAYCGEKSDAMHMDHVIPLSRGGRHGIANVLPACPTCNLSKNAAFLVEWRARRRTAAA